MTGINKEYEDCSKNEKCKSKMSDEMKQNSKTIQDLIKKITDLKKPAVSQDIVAPASLAPKVAEAASLEAKANMTQSESTSTMTKQ